MEPVVRMARKFFWTEVVPREALVSEGRLCEHEAENQSEEIRPFSGIIFR
jgi:hypothetical protein